jgi:hypothetical protein
MIPADLSIYSIARQQNTNLRRTQEQQVKRLLLVLALLGSNANLGKECLQSRFFQEILSREHDITDATDGKCACLLQHTEYTTWLRRDRELLWVKGKPGAGKSALLKHSLRDAKERTDDRHTHLGTSLWSLLSPSMAVAGLSRNFLSARSDRSYIRFCIRFLSSYPS